MTVKEFLKSVNVNIDDNTCLASNNLLAELARFNINIDYEKNIAELIDNEIYQIGRLLILPENKMKPFFNTEIIDILKKKIEEKS